MESIDTDIDNNQTKTLERFRSFSLVFNKPISTRILENLPKEKEFYSKYSRVIEAKVDREVQTLIIQDYFDINYVLNFEGIKANSNKIDDAKKIKGNLKLMGDLIINIFNLDVTYEIKDGLDFRYIENYNLQKLLNEAKITKLLRKEFGNNIFIVQCKYILKTKDGDKVFNFSYPDSNDLKNKRLLIEADEEYIQVLQKVLTNDGL